MKNVRFFGSYLIVDIQREIAFSYSFGNGRRVHII
jgi:hypothetical protein